VIAWSSWWRIDSGTTGRVCLSAAHEHVSSALTILKASPSPSKTQAQGVHLVKAKRKK
jgi:hypothetical protein